MTWWEWALLTTFAPAPGWLVWRWRVRRAREAAEAKIAAEVMDYRRRKFGGAIKVPGQKDAQPIERPQGENR